MDAPLIPAPQVLDPNRPFGHNADTELTADNRSRAELLSIALQESCGYAQQLWDNLNALRQYLLDSLPPDPHISHATTATGAAPTGPYDDQGWQHWINAFAATTSVLCGPHGDSGFGLSSARLEAQQRRAIPVPPAVAAPSNQATPDETRNVTPTSSAGAGAAGTLSNGEAILSPSRGKPSVARLAGITVLAYLALRALHRPRTVRAVQDDTSCRRLRT